VYVRGKKNGCQEKYEKTTTLSITRIARTFYKYSQTAAKQHIQVVLKVFSFI
jgi:hypothetical protein